ncbi:MAG: DNA mismatch repair endonuclease MutL [Bacteroidales bacterium]|nr:DNA mismatch repair endonuclease MutL [Bacteroidales bacterium]
MNIRVLPGNIANMIAAGEVVQRPASVVKELVENAVDAGADKIDVSILDGGRTLIRVVDNGCGMSPDDAVLCFERHATSKIASAEDLEKILTFGFRGEALASIAAIAEVTLRTRREEDETGCEVCMAASVQKSIESVAAPKGTSFSVRNLFYNVPARRKYLKSDAVEFRHIVEEFQRVALTRCDVAFSLSHNGKEVFRLAPTASLKVRIKDLFGGDVATQLLDITTQTSVVGVNGFVGKPESARKGSGNQFFFVNGRYFRSPYLSKAVQKAYEGLVPDGMLPPWFLFLEVPPYSVDVNVSPTKTEIKFEEDAIIYQTLFAAVKGVLGKQSFGDTIDFEGSRQTQIPVTSRIFDELHPLRSPDKKTDAAYNPFETDGFENEPDTFGGNGPVAADFPAGGGPSMGGYGPSYPTGAAVDRDQNYGKLFDGQAVGLTNVLVFKNKYILTPLSDSLAVIHIRRARLRILYDKYSRILSDQAHSTQTALFETAVFVGVEGALLLEDNAALLEHLGFDIRPLGNDTVVISGVPEGFSAESGKVEQTVSDILAILSDRSVSLEETMQSALALKFAQAVVGGEQNVSSQEAQRLINDLFACTEHEITPQGKRIYTRLPQEQIEKLF